MVATTPFGAGRHRLGHGGGARGAGRGLATRGPHHRAGGCTDRHHAVPDARADGDGHPHVHTGADCDSDTGADDQRDAAPHTRSGHQHQSAAAVKHQQHDPTEDDQQHDPTEDDQQHDAAEFVQQHDTGFDDQDGVCHHHMHGVGNNHRPRLRIRNRDDPGRPGDGREVGQLDFAVRRFGEHVGDRHRRHAPDLLVEDRAWVVLVSGVWGYWPALIVVGGLIVAVLMFRSEHIPRDLQRTFTTDQKAAASDRCGHQCEHKPMFWRRCREVPTHGDHIVPWSRGGRTDTANLQMLCQRHNLRKGALMPSRFYRWRLARRRRNYPV